MTTTMLIILCVSFAAGGVVGHIGIHVLHGRQTTREIPGHAPPELEPYDPEAEAKQAEREWDAAYNAHVREAREVRRWKAYEEAARARKLLEEKGRHRVAEMLYAPVPGWVRDELRKMREPDDT